MKSYLSLMLCGLCLLGGCGGGSMGGSPRATLSTTNLAFGNEEVGTTSPTQTVTLTNSGTAVLTIMSIAATNDFWATNTCGSALAPGTTCTIDVTFSPSADGDFTSSVSIIDNAAGSPHTVALTGSGIPQTSACTPIGKACGPGSPRCCAAPFPHHSFCSSKTGVGTCLMN